jgi:hypothetical protein
MGKPNNARYFKCSYRGLEIPLDKPIDSIHDNNRE